MLLLTAWLKAFALTQILEVPLYARALHHGRGHGVPSLPLRQLKVTTSQKAFLTAFGASAITHPFVWFVFPGLFLGRPYWLYFLTAESFVVILETWYLKSFGVRRAFTWSFLTNGLSAGFGLMLNYLTRG